MEIKFKLGSTIEEAVNLLLNYNSKGESVYGVFNGVKLDSDTVTMNSAYEAITGLNKEEFNNYIEELK